MNTERLNGLSRCMAVLRSMEREKKNWPQATCDTTERDWKWPHEVAYDLFMEAEGKLEEALVVLSKGENNAQGE